MNIILLHAPTVLRYSQEFGLPEEAPHPAYLEACANNKVGDIVDGHRIVEISEDGVYAVEV